MTTSLVNNPELRNAIRDAARWYAVLQSPDVTHAEQQAWQHWLIEAPSHRLAWQEVERVQTCLTRVPGQVAAPALRGAALTRRELLNRLAMIAVAAPLGLLAWRWAPWEQWQAHYATAIGEQQPLILADGSQLVLNTATSADVDFTPSQRRVTLHRGEILVQTAPDPKRPPRPFLVDTPQGRIQALGTRFTVRSEGNETRITVLEKTVRVVNVSGNERRDVRQGQQLRFSANHLHPVSQAPSGAGSWTSGNLMVVDMPLQDWVAEISRYRPGHLACSDATAGIRVSGTFPLADTDRALTLITETFPVRQRRLTPYWVTLVAE